MKNRSLHSYCLAYGAWALSIFLTIVALTAPLQSQAAPLCQSLFIPAALKAQSVHYEILGQPSKTPLVLIHGVGASLETFRPVALELAKRHQVILYDLRGHGRTLDPAEGFQIDTQVKDLEALLRLLKIKRFHLLGHSAGAKIAMAMAIKNPNRVASMILEDSGPLPLAKVEAAEIQETTMTAHYLRGLQKNYANLKDLENDLLPLFPHDPSQAQDLSTKVFAIGTRASAVTKQFWLEFKGSDTQNFLTTYDGPTLFLRASPGTRYLTDRDVELIQSQMPQASIVNIQDGSHSIHRKRPDLWLQHVSQFLEEN